MARKRKSVDDLYDAKHYGKSDNAPESGSLTQDERAYIEAGLSALALLRKTFETWVTVGKAIQTLRAKANRIGTRKAFARLLEQQGFGEFIKDKATVTRLLRIMENLGEVGAWHASLPVKQQMAWAHPSTVFLHCPIFKKPKAEGAPKSKQPVKQNDVREREALTARVGELQEELKAAKDDRTPTFDQAVEIVIAKLAAMPKTKLLATWKEIARRLGEATTRKPARKSKGSGSGRDYGEAVADAVEALGARGSDA